MSLLDLVEEIEGSAAAGHWYAAAALALAMPDICGSIDEPGRGRSEARYSRWWHEFAEEAFTVDIGVKYSFITGADAYYLRCAYLHEGGDRLAGKRQAQDRVRLFVRDADDPLMGHVPNAVPSPYVPLTKGAVLVPVDRFVLAIASGVRSWLKARAGNPVVEAKLAALIEIGPNPYK